MGTRETSRDDVEVVRVVRTIEVDAPIERVWESMSRLDQLAGWLGVDVRRGDEGHGRARRDDQQPDDDQDVAGQLVVGAAARLVEPDGSVRHLLVTDLDESHRLAWHWWREDGDLSAVEITVVPAHDHGQDGRTATVVQVVETLALASSAGGRAALEVSMRLDDEWGAILPGLAVRLARKLGVPIPR